MKDWLDLSNLNPSDKFFDDSKRYSFFNLKVDTGSKNIASFVGIKKKAYQLSFEDESTCQTKLKGCPSSEISLIREFQLTNLLIDKKESLTIDKIFKFDIKNHTVRMISYNKTVLNSVDFSSKYLSCLFCNTPFNYFNSSSECKSLDCLRKKLFLKIYNRLSKENSLS